MNSRLRHLVALIALIALTAGTVQGLRASTCPMKTALGVVASTKVAAPHGVCAHGTIFVSDRTDSYPNGGGPDAPHCPLMPTGIAGSCNAVMALPSESPGALEPFFAQTLLPRLSNQTRDLLLAAAFFRPPIASFPLAGTYPGVDPRCHRGPSQPSGVPACAPQSSALSLGASGRWAMVSIGPQVSAPGERIHPAVHEQAASVTRNISQFKPGEVRR